MLRRKLLYEQVVEEIVQRIRSGVYKPGDRLPTEKELVEELGVSRNSLREAMKCLITAGLVTSTSGKGTFLSQKARELVAKEDLLIDLSVYESVSEIIELRHIVEPESAFLAAQRATPDQVEELHGVLLSLRDRINRKEHWETTGLRFHNLIARMTGNRLLISVMESISKELYKSREYIYELIILQETEWEEHRAIYEAVRERDPEQARACMSKHLETLRSYLKSD